MTEGADCSIETLFPLLCMIEIFLLLRCYSISHFCGVNGLYIIMHILVDVFIVRTGLVVIGDAVVQFGSTRI